MITKNVYRVCRRDVLDELVTLHNFSNQFLPNALRDFFRHIHAPEERGEYLETLITKFSHRFCACNPTLVQDVGLSPGKWTTIITDTRMALLLWCDLVCNCDIKITFVCFAGCQACTAVTSDVHRFLPKATIKVQVLVLILVHANHKLQD